MFMKELFDSVSIQCSTLTTKSYSTSFSLGIYFLDKRFHNPIYSIYGFVRFADEIVDSFHGYNKQQLLDKFCKDTWEAIEDGISLNPILNSFQTTVKKYGIDKSLIETFLKSMATDLSATTHDRKSYEEYIVGSAEVVGLMCLRVFTEGKDELYKKLLPSAMKLGAAFQKVNFLRDIKADFEGLGRNYFPNIDTLNFTIAEKKVIEKEIEADFAEALSGIKQLPIGAKKGVYLAYVYYYYLFSKIKKIPAEKILQERIRISNGFKLYLMVDSMIRYKINII